MEVGFVQAGPVRLQIFCHGRGAESIVFVHGFRASGRVWRLVQEALDERRFRSIAISNRGAGESDRSDREADYTFEAFAENLWDAVTALDLTDFTLVGASMGGLTVTRFALDHPRVVKRLVLLDPAPLDGRARIARPADASPAENDLDADGVPEDFRIAVQADVDQNPPARIAAGPKSMATARLRDRLGELAMPVLVVGGDRDQAVGVDNILAEYRALPESTRSLHIFHGIGHSPNIIVPRQLADVLDRFIAG